MGELMALLAQCMIPTDKSVLQAIKRLGNAAKGESSVAAAPVIKGYGKKAKEQQRIEAEKAKQAPQTAKMMDEKHAQVARLYALATDTSALLLDKGVMCKQDFSEFMLSSLELNNRFDCAAQISMTIP